MQKKLFFCDKIFFKKLKPFKKTKLFFFENQELTVWICVNIPNVATRTYAWVTWLYAMVAWPGHLTKNFLSYIEM